MASMSEKIPITIVTGFLGSGKTTLILNLIPQLPQDYKLALLKNEFGDLAIDSKLASSSAISGVQELLNGCICCNLVGQLGEALESLRATISPDRIIIETSGSAFPATLAIEVNRIAQETRQYLLDGVVSVIDAENWQGYEDTSYTAKLQARYTDLIVISKWELVNERKLEDCEDHILALEVDPPTPRTKSRKGWVDKDIIFGLDAKLSKDLFSKPITEHNHDHHKEVEVLSITLMAPLGEKLGVNLEKLSSLLHNAPRDEVYRIKAILYASSTPQSSETETDIPMGNISDPSLFLLNWAFGRWTFTAANSKIIDGGTMLTSEPPPASVVPIGEPVLRMTIITAPYEANKWQRKIESENLITLTPTSGHLHISRIS